MKYLFLIFLGLEAFADSGEKVLAGFDARVDVIAENYEAGPYLIYDCEEKHYTCVRESYHKACADKRDEDLGQKKLNLRCAPLGALPTKKSCFQKQLFLVSQNYGTRFCIGPEWKQKEIDFGQRESIGFNRF